jgi:hypothetical protein
MDENKISFVKNSEYIPGIFLACPLEKVHTWNIPGIYQENKIWGFQMRDRTVTVAPVSHRDGNPGSG